MTVGLSLLLIATGAILRYAISADVEGVNLDEVGLILMIVGVVGFVISLIYEAIAVGERSRYYRFWARDRYPPPGPDDATRRY
jgi:hypothetical protein